MFQASATGQDVVGNIQHMVRLGVRQIDLEGSMACLLTMKPPRTSEVFEFFCAQQKQTNRNTLVLGLARTG
jgi:hypothetical protein